MRRTVHQAMIALVLAVTTVLVGGVSSASAAGPAGVVVVAQPDDLHRLVPDETAMVSVLVNDTVNGSPATPADAEVTQSDAPDPGLVLDRTGFLRVGPTVQPGAYTISYMVCAIADPTACGSSTVALSVGAVVTISSSFGVTGVPGGTTPSVLGGVLLNGLPASSATVSVRPGEAPLEALGLRMRVDGTVDIEASTPPGTYVYPYTACAEVEPFVCPTGAAFVTVTGASVAPPPPPVDELPRTGAELSPLAGLGTVSVAAGALLLVARQRRHTRLLPAPRRRLR